MDSYEQLKAEVTDIILSTIPSKRIFKMIMGISAENLAGKIAKVSKYYMDKRLEKVEERLSKLEERLAIEEKGNQ